MERNSKLEGSNRKATSSHHYNPNNDYYPRWHSPEAPTTRLPSFAQLEAQLLHPSALNHSVNISELVADAGSEDIIDLEDWERIHVARDKASSSGYDTSRIDSPGNPPLVYDGATLGLGKTDGVNAASDAGSLSFPLRSPLRKPRSSLYNQKSLDTATAISSGNINNAAGSVAAKRLVVKLRYGRNNRRKVAAMLKLPTKRKDPDGIHALPQNSINPSHWAHNWSQPFPYQDSASLNEGAESITEAFRMKDFRISPGKSSNEVMMRFESNAKELEVASRAATDASHRSISDDEDNISVIPDTTREPRDELPTEGGTPTAFPSKFFNSDEYPSVDDQLGQSTYNELDNGSGVATPAFLFGCDNPEPDVDQDYQSIIAGAESWQTPDLNWVDMFDLSDMRNTPTSRSLFGHDLSGRGTIFDDNPMAVANLSVDGDAQMAGHQIPLIFETYTDSGYASNNTSADKRSELLGQIQRTEVVLAGHAENESQSVYSLNRDVQRVEQDDDETSIYSNTTTIPTMIRARYIHGLADDLVSVIQPYHLNYEIFQEIVEKLPELLKAFALTFGHHESGTMHRDVMVFIHKYRRQIVETLNDHMSTEEDEYQDSDQANQMSLNEKMDLWLTKGQSTQGAGFEIPDHNDNHDTNDFDGKETQDDDDDVDDDDEDEEQDYESEADVDELPGLAAYRSFIRGAPAYGWFLDKIRRECTLAPPEPNLIKEIRNTILAALPSSPKISRRKPAESFNVSFMVNWDPIAFLREEEYTERPEDAIERAIVLTGSSASAQALTCGEYLRQTWPSTGEQILYLIKSLVSGQNIAPVTLLNGSSLTVSYHPSCNQGSSATVWVETHGTAACVAEIGEQFAWLASALRSSPFLHKLAYSRPFVDGIKIGHVTYEESTYVCKIEVELHEGKADPEITNGECWHGLFARPVVVEGFPIPRRSEGESPGVEIPLNIMAGLSQARRVGSFGGKTILKGFATMLLPMKRTKETVTWHLVQSRNGERISYFEADEFQTVDIQMSEVEKSRHILGWCPEMRLYAGAADASYFIGGSRLPRPSGQGGLSDASLSLGHLVTGGTPFSEGRKDIRLRRNSYIVRMKWISQKFVILWDVEDKRGWLVNGASALLHLVRASLTQDMFDNKFRPLCLFSTKDFQEASQVYQADAALEVLLNPNNLKAKIYPEEDDFIRFKAYVEDFSDLLEKMLDYQSRVVNQNIPRSLLEGWDFNDLATGRDPIYPREAFLNREALSWVDFTRTIHAITLFGRSFGEVIQPAKASCSAWAKVPCGKSFLAASTTDLYRIMEWDGDPYSVPMRLTHDIVWYFSKETFAQCQCNSEADDDAHCDIVQVLLPSRLQNELSGTCSHLPSKSGAVIFGYNDTRRWFWGDTGDPSRTPNESDRMSPFKKGARGSHFSDSGIGKSLGSSTSITNSASNRLDEESTEYTHAINSDTDDHQSSSSTYNKRNNRLEINSISSPLASHYKVGIVCALHIELMAVRASFDKTYEKVAIAGEDPNYYALGRIEGHNVVAVCLPHGVYGTNAAADVTSNMKRSFPGLKFCLLVGIGAGVPSPRNDIRLGDVVISIPKGRYSGVLPYDMIKSTDSGAFELNGYLSPPPAHLMCAISELESDPSLSSTPLHRYLQQIEQCKQQYTHPGAAYDRLFASDYTHNGDYNTSDNCNECNIAYEKNRPPRSSTHPKIHYGLIASGNQVMKSAEIRDKLSREHNVLCFEMEGAGIMNNFPCLIIRGICDYADSHKNKRWQNYAAAVAAAYAKLLLSRLRAADGFESEPVERLSRKRTATTEWGEDMLAAKRSRT